MTFEEYLISRVTSLKPPKTNPENPLKLLALLNRQQCAFFIVSFLAWTWDAFDFFTVTLNVREIGEEFQRSTVDVTWSITVTLMLRSLGAIIFGLVGDQFGRKWPFVVNIIFYGLIEVATGFSTNFTGFILCRALFGIAMGGIYGNCAATALEDAPVAARGLLSGILQKGYTVGFLLAAVFNLLITHHQRYRWRALFWFGGIPPIFIALWRMYLPETKTFVDLRRARIAEATEKHPNDSEPEMKIFFRTMKNAIAQDWLIVIYMVLMMAGLNFLSHGSQDLYPTFLESSLNFSPLMITMTIVVANCGSLMGSILLGYFSTFIGRRLTILIGLLLGILLIPVYVLPENSAIIAGAFFEQLFGIGIWGVVPIYLLELAPAECRSFVVGTAYQLGNLVASGVVTMEAKVAQYFPKKSLTITSAVRESYDYGKVIGIFLLVIYAFLISVIFLGTDKHEEKPGTTTDKPVETISLETTN